MKNNLTQENLKDIQHHYAFGECAVFAIALSKKYNYPIVEFYAGDDMYHVALVIEGRTINDDIFLDAFGENSYQDIQNRYTMPGLPKIEVKTEEELKNMTLFSQEDIDEAQKNLNILLENQTIIFRHNKKEFKPK